jgi:hypothetical protein
MRKLRHLFTRAEFYSSGYEDGFTRQARNKAPNLCTTTDLPTGGNCERETCDTEEYGLCGRDCSITVRHGLGSVPCR